jgi:hypothetical protein
VGISSYAEAVRSSVGGGTRVQTAGCGGDLVRDGEDFFACLGAGAFLTGGGLFCFGEALFRSSG